MNRVEIVNLGGRAHQIEAAGASAIEAWLANASRSLNGDPDRDDLLLDFERAIGEKCDAGIGGGRDVVTAEQVAAILESLGTIQPSGVGELVFAGGPSMAERTRRLFRLPHEAMIAGVCSGMAAWLGVDVTVVRVAWVGFPIFTLGLTDGASVPLFVGLYVLLALLLPRANSPESRAAAYGRGTTAQDVMLESRSSTMPALSTVGARLGAIIRLAMRAARVMLLVAIVALLAASVVGAGWLAVAGEPLITAFGSDVSRSLVPALFACAAVIAVAPLVASAALLDQAIRASAGGRWQGRQITVWLLGSTAALVIAVVLAVGLVVTIPSVRDALADGEGRVPFMGTTYCFYDGVDKSHCLPGDEFVVTGDARPYVVPAQPFKPTEQRLPAKPLVPFEPIVPLEPLAPEAPRD